MLSYDLLYLHKLPDSEALLVPKKGLEFNGIHCCQFTFIGCGSVYDKETGHIQDTKGRSVGNVEDVEKVRFSELKLELQVRIGALETRTEGMIVGRVL